MIMIDHKNNKPKEPGDIKMMIQASLAFILTMVLLAVLLAVWSVR